MRTNSTYNSWQKFCIFVFTYFRYFCPLEAVQSPKIQYNVLNRTKLFILFNLFLNIKQTFSYQISFYSNVVYYSLNGYAMIYFTNPLVHDFQGHFKVLVIKKKITCTSLYMHL